jgi:hypothetical protein
MTLNIIVDFLLDVMYILQPHFIIYKAETKRVLTETYAGSKALLAQ